MERLLVSLNRVAWKLLGTSYQSRQSIVASLGAWSNVDFLPLAYAQRGILKYRAGESGEDFLVSEVLAKTITEKPVVIDVGANIGDYTQRIHESFPNARIFSFEPNPALVNKLQNRVGLYATVIPSAVGDQRGTIKLFNSIDPNASSHGSVHAGALSDFHGYKNLVEVDVPITTLDDFTREQCVDQIDFLKIDTEGHEFAVLCGSRRLLSEGRIGCIQFEFNEMNITSRVFMKDFFSILNGFDFYRLDTSRLHPLKYSPREELFQFQNIVAVASRNQLAEKLRQGLRT